MSNVVVSFYVDIASEEVEGQVRECFADYRIEVYGVPKRVYAVKVLDTVSVEEVYQAVRRWYNEGRPVYSVAIRGENNEFRVVMPQRLEYAAESFLSALNYLGTKAEVSFVNCDDGDAVLKNPILIYTQYGFEVLLEEAQNI